ncbi:MAG TPA: diaminopimelate epimerase [Acidimicrobiales bacterium]|jgi:diaminopimelate epimerase
MRLTKHHGLGNDFLVLLDLDGTHPVSGDTARSLCDRHRGIGADGLVRVTAGSSDGQRVVDVTMQLLNADGGRAEMSGNGISCLAQAVRLAGMVTRPTINVATDAGFRAVTLEPTDQRGVHRANVDMGAVKVGEDESEWTDDEVLRAVRVDVGNPHLVMHVAERLDDAEVIGLGRHVNELVPGGINVELVTPGPIAGEVTMQVYERGVGLTEACGTGACAVAAAAQRWELCGRAVRVHQPGGAADIVLGPTVEMKVTVHYIGIVDVPQ